MFLHPGECCTRRKGLLWFEKKKKNRWGIFLHPEYSIREVFDHATPIRRNHKVGKGQKKGEGSV